MSDSQAPFQGSGPRRVDIRHRTFMAGGLVAINGYRADKNLLKQRLAEGGYRLDETPHFLLFRRTEAPSMLIVHWFAPGEIDANIGHYFLQELKPLGVLNHTDDFANFFSAIVCSLFPNDAQRALRLYADNTLQRYRSFLAGTSAPILPSSTIDTFATLYKRVDELQVGTTLLDAGCSSGFLPLLMAERHPALTHIVGVDIYSDPFTIARAIAAESLLTQVHYIEADLLAEHLDQPGRFDTVTALHVLEHFSEEEMYRVLNNLLELTSRRLIIAVPYETAQPEAAYGHKQLFTLEKLEAIGGWCLQQSHRQGRASYEDCAGGLLIIDLT